MNTKDRIIQQSITLFNENGISAVSLRHIAGALHISHGNLTYHYKNKQAITNEIYTRMDKEMESAVFPGEPEADLFHYHKLLHRISDFQKRHRFFYLDMLEISRLFPEVIIRYRKTIETRGAQTRQLFDALIKKELVKPEQDPGLYRSLTHSIWVMSTFWLQQEQILGKDHPAISKGSDVERIWEIMRPYLTPKGLKQYHQLKGVQQ